MTTRKILILSLIISMGIWSLFSWPLPRYISNGIPASAANVEKGNVRHMVMGDHLQLLYNYWVFSDMLSGKTRFFHNLYEFNTGNDDARRYLGFDFVPFTLVFTPLYWIGGRAFAWNLTSIFSIWITYFFSWLLLRRYTKKDLIASLMALIVVALPYLWTVQLGGSPTAFAMTFIPMMLWGIDLAIRRGNVYGGMVAAIAILCFQLNGAHVLLFSFFIAPCWTAFTLLQVENKPFLDFKRWLKMTIALLPLAFAMLFVFVIVQLSQNNIANTTIEHARTSHEVAICTPDISGLYSWKSLNSSSSIYIGFVLPILFLMGLLSQAWMFIKKPSSNWRRSCVLLAAFFAVSLLVMLALGPNGPKNGRVFELARRWIPHYNMIRQPTKIFSFMPIMLSVAAALSMKSIFGLINGTRLQTVILVAVTALFCLEYKIQIKPTVCIIDKTQSAYAAVADDARANGRDPRAIAIPIWPGDSAWSSLYEHYSSLYRIRMINGYLPVVPNDYIDNIYHVFEYMNGGIVTDAQLDNLQNRGIDYVLLHEDAFPEQVSSFAVSFTLKRFLDCPRLKLLHQGENVWAFKILNTAKPKPPLNLGWNIFFPSQYSYHEAEWLTQTNTTNFADTSASGDRYVELSQPGAKLTLNPLYHCSAPHPMILLRGRGHGTMGLDMTSDNGISNRLQIAWNSDNWLWREAHLYGLSNSVTGNLQLQRDDGSFAIDAMMFSSGSILNIKPGQDLKLPAPLFFHAGYTDLKSGSVVIRSDYESSGVILYGPNLPLTAGEYEVRMLFTTAATADTDLGSFTLSCGDDKHGPFPVTAGNSPAICRFSTPPKNLPVVLAFKYSCNANMKIQQVIFRRIR